jgi:hypothetical protein
MIRHAFCSRGSRDGCLAHPVRTLTIAMVEAPFGRLLMPAACRALLLETGSLAAILAAITLTPIAVRADEEEDSTIRSLTKSLPENRFWRC